ncbi:LOW QUALITY PROTEIN: ras and Rab interactor 2-like [Lethenteron reissneri]|uniref:LOW QUALITY PROTEIN: ras and Rab interactor 2-like n=1 Tax=Lethenteron reissneri TaxID=7753 RepID=UPI002AB764D9|nr:LOW QUALITY PROTEIN: ras and Rab interactor 2-like [Lethenteron reissneri]
MAVTSGPSKLQRMMDESGCEPDYDELEERPPPARSWCLPRQPSRRNISVLDRLILSHPVWLQLTVNPAKAMHILQREPCGAFLVRRSSTIQKKILSVRLSSEEGSCFVKDFAIIETQSTFSLEGSSISFADLFRLVAFYCVSRDVLPFTLKLPHAIDAATSAKELEAISHLGIEFWNSSRNQRKAERGTGDTGDMGGSPSVRTRAPCQLATPKGRALCFINPLFLEEHTEGASLRRAWSRSAGGVRVSTETGTSQLSPPPRPPPPVPRRRGSSNDGAGSRNGNDLRHSLSGEGDDAAAVAATHRAGSSDSGVVPPRREPPDVNGHAGGGGCGGGSYDVPKAPMVRPVPPPRLKKLSSSPVEKKPLSTQGRVAKVGWVADHVDHVQLERAPSEEKPRERQESESADTPTGYRVPLSSAHAFSGSCFLTNGNDSLADDQGSDTLSNELLSDDQSLFDFIAGKVPAIPELDSASMSSMEEEEDDEEEEEEGIFGEVLEVDETESSYQTPPALRRSTALALRGKVRSSFRKFSEVLHLLLTPERRVVRKIVELAQEKRSYFGSLLQDYITFIQENGNNYQSSSDLLQAVRQLLNQLKAYLLHTHELDPPIESLIPDSDIDAVIEKALHKCLLKPLKGQVDAWMRDFRSVDGSARRLRENLQLARESSLADFGAGGVGGAAGGAAGGAGAGAAVRLPNVPDAACLERIRVTLAHMHATYSPSKKVLLLLKACKFIYDAMGSGLGTMFGADDFMPVLMYVLARCDMPFLDMEVEYMMELLDPSLLSGEGGYYLTTVYGALFLLKNYHQEEAGWRLKTDARDSLRQWHRRRTVNNKDLPSFDDIQNFIRVAFQDSGCTGKTLSTHPYATTDEVSRLCADKFRVPDPANFGLFLLVDGTWQQLAVDTHPLKIKAELHSKERLQPFFFIYRRLGTSPLPSPGP